MLGGIRKRFDAQFSKMDEDELIELLWNQAPPEALAALPVLAVRSRPSKSGKTRQLTKTEFFALFHKAVRGRPLNLFETAEGFLRWFVLMTRCEAEIFSMLRRAYPAATLFVQHMMDMDNYYPGRSWYPFVTEQLPRMRDLTGSSKGQLLTFVAFDPKRKEWKEVLDVALRSTGVKFYPPNGYRASGDSDPVVCKRIKEFFAYCVEKMCQCLRTALLLDSRLFHTVEDYRILSIGNPCSERTERCGCVLRTPAGVRYGLAGQTTRKASHTERK
jgi:hypothetical protein